MRIEVSLSAESYTQMHKKWGICRTVREPVKVEPSKIPAIVSSLVKSWKMKPYDINNGNCDEFALDLLARIGGDILETNPMGDDTPELGQDLPGHVWVFNSGKHYDAEHPKGVDDWRKLGIFQQDGSPVKANKGIK